MAQMNTIIVIVTALLVSPLNAQSIITQPESATIIKGSELTLVCEISKPDEGVFFWKEFITDQSGAGIFTVKPTNYPDGELNQPDKYEIRDTFNLHFKEIVVTDGGSYTCEVVTLNKNDPIYKSQVDVIVLDQPRMLIPDMMEGERSEMSCSINYGGPRTDDETPEDHIPQMRMEFDGKLVETIEERTEGKPGTNYQEHTIKLTLNMTADAAYNGLNLTCIASTVKPFYEVSVHHTIDVKYKVRDISTAPNNNFFYVDEMINCSASGNPEPTFKWSPIRSSGGVTINGQVLTISSRMMGENEWQCQATNNAQVIETVKVIVEFDVVPTVGEGGNGASSPRLQSNASFMAVFIMLVSLLK